MKLPEHFALSFLLAQFGVQQEYGPAGTALMMAAGCLPDLDGFTLLGGWHVYRKYHRVLGHGLPMTLAGPALLALFGAAVGLGPVWLLWAWLQVALLAHLVTDVLFYRWPVQLLWPLSRRGWAAGLLTWNDLVPTLVLYAGTGLALLWRAEAPLVAALAVGLFGLYLLRRRLKPRSRWGWRAWLTGDWAAQARPVWRWLTGDFIP